MNTNEFDQWNMQKQKVHFESKNKFYKEREIWWCALGINIGFEQRGDDIQYRRPILILKGLSRSTCLIVPLTSSRNKHSYRVPLGKINGIENSALLSQIKTIDTKRLISKITDLNQEIFRIIRKTAKDLL